MISTSFWPSGNGTTRPSLASGIAKRTGSAATRKSQWSASSHPPAHLFRIPAGAERGAGAAQDDDPHARVTLELVEAAAQLVEHRGVERVAALGAIERDGRDRVGDRAQDFVGHQRNSERAITMRWTSDGPSPMRRTRASRYQRSSGNSFDTP